MNDKIGLDDLLVKHGKEGLTKLVAEATPTFERHVEEGTPVELILKELSRLESGIEKENIYKKIAKKKKIQIDAVRKEATKYQPKVEEKKVDEDRETFSEEEIKSAKELLNEPNILDKMIDLIERAGYVGEERNKELIYLSFTSRKLPGGGRAISLMARGDSSSGKSGLVKHILKLIPSREYKELTYITEKALLHMKEDLSHKILCLFEREGGRQADYSIRTSISEGKLSILIPVKDPISGEFESVEKEIPAEGMVYIETTTEDSIEPQNANRTFELFTNSSEELTREVLISQGEKQTLDEDELEQEYKVWRCAQDRLEPMPVYVPYAKELAEKFPAKKVRARRDFPRLLALIETSAFLHQKNRERIEIGNRTFIVATKQDFDTAYEIVQPILEQTYKELTPKEENLAQIIKEEFDIGEFADSGEFESQGKGIFSPKDLSEKIKARIKEKDKIARSFDAYSTLRSYIRKLTKKGFLEWNNGEGIKSKYVLISDVTKISFRLELSSSANTPESDKSTKESGDLQSKALAKKDSSQSLANQSESDTLAKDEPISSTLAKGDISSSTSYKSLDNSGISSLAKGDIEAPVDDTIPDEDPWDENEEASG